MNNCTEKARFAAVHFCDGLSVDGYQLPNGEFAVSITSVSKVLGFQKNWLGRSISRSGNTFKALLEKGFSGKTEQVVTPSIGGDQTSVVISLKDFNRIVLFAASKGKAEAVALADALIDMSMTDIFRDTFGERPLTLEEKRARFYKSYAASLTREDWLEMDRIDFKVINEQLEFVGELTGI